MFLRLLFFEMLRTKPTAISGIASAEMSALKPKIAIIHAVIVVPIFAPIITLIACESVSKQAFTKPTTITVVALDDCITEVTPKPVITPLIGFPVSREIIFRKPSPALFCSEVLNIFMPQRNIPNEPNKVKIDIIIYLILKFYDTKVYENLLTIIPIILVN